MIPLRLSLKMDPAVPPFVVRLNRDWSPDHGEADAHLCNEGDGDLVYQSKHGTITLGSVSAADLDGDVLLVVPHGRSARRLIRAKSRHNPLVITERCDQRCVMCSQPPHEEHVDMFDYFASAIQLAPADSSITLTGGEPTLFKDQLLELLLFTQRTRPDLSIHVLSNGQYLEGSDIPTLKQLRSVLWGVPLYSENAATHDSIVEKSGAFERLQSSLSILLRSNSRIELRTVVMKQNISGLSDLATHISIHHPSIAVWSIMQLERIGFARMNWSKIFFDNSLDFSAIGRAINFARARGIETLLYNFPLCSVPASYRHYAPSTISDWKRKYLPRCDDCSARGACGGFFDWYREADGFERIHVI